MEMDKTVTIRLNNDLLKKINKNRGDVSLSLFIRNTMEKVLK